jgi:glutamate-1-semialdehyde 2,1-aminomutase
MTQLLSKRPDQFSSGVWPGYFNRAKGVEVWDLDGNRYIDMSIGGIGATVLGYADPDVDSAVLRAIEKGTSCSLNCAEDVELADLLCEIHPWAEKVRFARTGGESMSIAIRIARAHTGKDKIAFCGYHGWHDWYLSANLNDGEALDEHLLKGLDSAGVPKALAGTSFPFRYNDIEELRNIIAKNRGDIAAIVMEPVRNVYPEDGFLNQVRSIADEAGAVFIFDEISSAFRMNSGGAHLQYGVSPDMAVFSKSIGNGYPIAAVIGKGDIMDAAQKTFISSSNWTERIGPVAAIATIRKHRELDVGSHLVHIGRAVQKGWSDLAGKHDISIEVAGIPPLSHFTFKAEHPLTCKAYFVQMMLDRGILASTIFYSMYAHTDEHVKTYLDAVDETFAEISLQRDRGALDSCLRGKPAVAGFKRLN